MRSERLKLNFTKMQTCGNDYIYIDCFEKEIASPEFLSIYLADRHTGVGGDGVVLISKSNVADAKMRMFNLDGSEAKICGNAVRCVAKYLFDNKIVSDRELTIETLSGVKLCKVFTKNGIVNRVKVNMGKPSLDPKTVPVNLDGESVINRPVEIGGKIYNITCVSMGNPHCVVFCDETETLDVEALGAEFENSGLFPEGINVEFVQPIEENLIKMRVFERGTGETFACGTGACAAAYAAILNGICDGEKIVKVLALGGELTVRCKPDYITLAGHTEKVFDGTVLV
jgi:carbamoyl-phosphate synthase large subunit